MVNKRLRINIAPDMHAKLARDSGFSLGPDIGSFGFLEMAPVSGIKERKKTCEWLGIWLLCGVIIIVCIYVFEDSLPYI